VNPSATFLSKHTTALFLALRFTPFCFNVSKTTNLRHVFLRPLIFGLPKFRWCVYTFKSFFLCEYHFLFTTFSTFSKTQEGLRIFTLTSPPPGLLSICYYSGSKPWKKVFKTNTLFSNHTGVICKGGGPQKGMLGPWNSKVALRTHLHNPRALPRPHPWRVLTTWLRPHSGKLFVCEGWLLISRRLCRRKCSRFILVQSRTCTHPGAVQSPSFLFLLSGLPGFRSVLASFHLLRHLPRSLFVVRWEWTATLGYPFSSVPCVLFTLLISNFI
jgi:hypothetical protein